MIIKSDLEEKHQAGGKFFLLASLPSHFLSGPVPWDFCCTQVMGSCQVLPSGNWLPEVGWGCSEKRIERTGRKKPAPFPSLCLPAYRCNWQGSPRFSRGLCSPAIKGALLILLSPRCSENIFNSSLLYASLWRHLIIHFKTRQLLSLCPPSHSDTQKENEL